jgi:hypothetical protein
MGENMVHCLGAVEAWGAQFPSPLIYIFIYVFSKIYCGIPRRFLPRKFQRVNTDGNF